MMPTEHDQALIHAWHHGVIRVVSIGVSGYLLLGKILPTYLTPGAQVPRHFLQRRHPVNECRSSQEQSPPPMFSLYLSSIPHRPITKVERRQRY